MVGGLYALYRLIDIVPQCSKIQYFELQIDKIDLVRYIDFASTF